MCLSVLMYILDYWCPINNNTTLNVQNFCALHEIQYRLIRNFQMKLQLDALAHIWATGHETLYLMETSNIGGDHNVDSE